MKWSNSWVIYMTISLIIACIGVLFKLCHWPGGIILSLLSLGTMIPVGLIWGCVSYVVNNRKK